MSYRGHRFGRLIVTTCWTAAPSPVFDTSGITIDHADGERFRSVCVALTPWRRDRYGQLVRQRALVVGWRR